MTESPSSTLPLKLVHLEDVCTKEWLDELRQSLQDLPPPLVKLVEKESMVCTTTDFWSHPHQVHVPCIPPHTKMVYPYALRCSAYVLPNRTTFIPVGQDEIRALLADKVICFSIRDGKLALKKVEYSLMGSATAPDTSKCHLPHMCIL